MLRVGLTGGIACGKSTVGQMLVARGAHFLSADTLAHSLYAPDGAVYNEVVRRFGREILNQDDTVNRKKLASLVFPDRVTELNAIVHPAVIEAQNRWMTQIESTDPHGVAVVEAALIFEAGVEKDFDRTIAVICSFEQKVERYGARMGMAIEAARADVERRSAAQLGDDEKARRADFVIDNSGSLEELGRQVGALWKKLQALAGK